jgi:hypothetical protein
MVKPVNDMFSDSDSLSLSPFVVDLFWAAETYACKDLAANSFKVTHDP